ncbi:hypothetical protein TcBrA4_0108740 [Trypanosoma cruzi]|nr:hypothetical protein TcBrA4_0108740 [Trypanosoma cruzi]
MEIELSDDTAQAAAEQPAAGVSVPDVTAQRRTGVSPLGVHPFTWIRTTKCHPTLRGRRTASRNRQACSHDGKHDAVVLHEADRDAFTLARGTPLATVITWLEMHRGTVRAAAVTVPQESGRTEWSRPSVLQRQPASS